MDFKECFTKSFKKWKRPTKIGNSGNIEGLSKYLAHRIGGDPHLWTKCMAHEKLQRYDQEARAAICARVHKIVTGYWTREKKPGGWTPADNKIKYDPSKKEVTTPESFEKGFRDAFKGGKGSGNFGHGGLPGVWGGSTSTFTANDFDKVSRFIDVDKATRGRRKEVEQAIHKGIGLIDQVHKASPGKRFPIKIINSSSSSSAQIQRYTSDNSTKCIEVNQRDSDMSMDDTTDLLHEMGHYFTLTSDGAPPQTAESKKAMQKLKDSLGATEGVKDLRHLLDHPGDYVPFTNNLALSYGAMPHKATSWVGEVKIRKHLRYLLQMNEILARSYAQYIVTKTKQKAALHILEGRAKIDKKYGVKFSAKSAVMTSIELPMQWTREDFEPITKAWDNYFRSVGWLNES